MNSIHDRDNIEVINPIPVEGTNSEYFYHPENSLIGISRDGKVIDNRFKRPIKVSTYLDKDKSKKPRCIISIPYLIDGVITRKTAVLARLVARTFVGRPDIHKNTDYKYLQVNHINLNPEDNRADNLEWCIASENMIHSFSHLNNSQQIEVLAKNLNTGEIKEFYSVNTAEAFFNIVEANLSLLLKKYSGGLKYQDWIFKYKDNNTWNDDVLFDIGNMRYRTVWMKNIINNKTLVFSSIVEAANYLDINYFTLAKAIRDDQIKTAHCKYWIIKLNETDLWPNVNIFANEIGNINQKIVGVKNLETGDIVEFNTFRDTYNYLGILEGRFRSYIGNNNYQKYRLGKYAIKLENDIDFPSLNMSSLDYPENKSVSLEAKNLNTGEIRKFVSTNAASKFLDIKRATLSNALNKRLNYKWRYGDWIIKLENEEWPDLNTNAPSIREVIPSQDIESLNIITGERTIYKSAYEASKILGISKSTLLRNLKNYNYFKVGDLEFKHI